MSKALVKQTGAAVSPEALSKLILGGDLKGLTSIEKVAYYNKVCEVVGLNPLTKPFDYITLSGKEVLYANKGCTEQLRGIHKISLKIASIQTVSDVYVVTVEASDASGRTDTATGAVQIKGLSGEALANAFMKCETKAKRRATLSICGLNMLDETEVASIPGAVIPPTPPTPTVAPVTPVVMGKEPPAGATAAGAGVATRDVIGQEIVAAKNALGMTNPELAAWAQNKFGQPDMRKLTSLQLLDLRNDLQNEMKGK